jgi:hypothetical protein
MQRQPSTKAKAAIKWVPWDFVVGLSTTVTSKQNNFNQHMPGANPTIF